MVGELRCKSCGAKLSRGALQMMDTNICPYCFKPYDGSTTSGGFGAAKREKKWWQFWK